MFYLKYVPAENTQIKKSAFASLETLNQKKRMNEWIRLQEKGTSATV